MANVISTMSAPQAPKLNNYLAACAGFVSSCSSSSSFVRLIRAETFANVACEGALRVQEHPQVFGKDDLIFKWRVGFCPSSPPSGAHRAASGVRQPKVIFLFR
jgi:hypothetical protein